MDETLLKIARNAIKEYLCLDFESIEIKNKWKEKRATFVTLTKGGELRGCIGSLEPIRSIYEDIRHNAVSAAFRDPRFFPLEQGELDEIKIEVSILSPLEELTFTTEEDLIKKIIPFKMGLVLEYGYNRGTFLPQVWDHYPEPREFFNHLKLKSGLSQDFFNEAMKVFFYEVEKCQE